MELMSSLLLCALVAMVRQALGQSSAKTEIRRKLNKIYLKEKPITNKKVVLKIIELPLINMVNEIQTVFSNKTCHTCIDCMERAIKPYKLKLYLTENQRGSNEFYNSVLSDHNQIYNFRVKRDTDNATIALEVKGTKAKLNSKNKVYKSMTVTKYNIDGVVYALKVKGTNKQNSFNENKNAKIISSDCQIYRIKKTFACDSSDAELFMANVKENTKKVRRSQKIKKGKTIQFVIPTTSEITTKYSKRNVDNSQVPENVMTSIEDFTY